MSPPPVLDRMDTRECLRMGQSYSSESWDGFIIFTCILENYNWVEIHLNIWTQCANVHVVTSSFIPVFFFISRSSNRQLRNCLDIVMSPIHLNPLCQINLGNTRLMKWKHVSDFLPPVPSVNELCKLNLPRALCQRCIFFFFTDWLLSHLIMRFVACIESGSGR